MRVAGDKVLIWKGSAAIKRHSQKLPHAGEKAYLVSRAGKLFRVLWRKWHGASVLAVADAPSRPYDVVNWTALEPVPMPIKRNVADPSTLVPPDLPSESKTLARFPTLRAFLTARSYTEGGVRLPGKIWLDAGSLGFSITLIDVDNAMRIVVRAGTLDDVFAAAELIAGADNAPWEPDEYQQKRRAEKNKKK